MTESSVHLRDARADDAESIAALLSELGHPAHASEIPARLSAVLREGGTVLVAVDERDRPLGLMTLARHASLHAAGPIAQITALVTSSRARRRGIGKLLVARAMEWARESGCVRLSVTSAERRSDAHEFYPASGLPYTGRRFATPIEEDPALGG